jgi:hypothetical protein
MHTGFIIGCGGGTSSFAFGIIDAKRTFSDGKATSGRYLGPCDEALPLAGLAA